MGPQPPPVAPKTGAKFTVQSWQAVHKMPEVEEPVNYGNHVRCSSLDSVDSNSGSSSCSSSGSNCKQLTNDPNDFLATRNLGKPVLPNHNALQFVKIQSSLCKKTDQHVYLAKEVKTPKEVLKETEEEWQSNLDNWKTRRRKVAEPIIQRAEEMRQIEAIEQVRQIKDPSRKTKTFSEIVETRSSKKRNYNLDLYMGKGDDSGVGGTPEPDEQDMLSDGQNFITRSDTSEGMTSETDSIDSDVQNEKVSKEPPKVPKKPHSRLVKNNLEDLIQRTANSSEFLQHRLVRKDLLISENTSSAEPSDVEGHAADNETVSSEDDIGFCGGPAHNVDSGLESLCESQRPNDTADSASDLSQDSCNGADKPSDNLQGIPRTTSCRNKVYAPDSKTWSNEEDQNAMEGTKLHITIESHPGVDFKSFGFSLTGGKDQDTDAFVDHVQPDSLSDVAGLKVADKLLSINGEPTFRFSHSSLIFSIKQASYTGKLDLVVLRQAKQTNFTNTECVPKQKKDSFAQKLALFSGASATNSNPGSLKSVKDGVQKNESLVLRRRSAFEKSQGENDDLKNRRSSCISGETATNHQEVEDRRHSLDFASTKKPPPAVPAKPKPKSKLQHEPCGVTNVHGNPVEETSFASSPIVEDSFNMGNCCDKLRKSPRPDSRPPPSAFLNLSPTTQPPTNESCVKVNAHSTSSNNRVICSGKLESAVLDSFKTSELLQETVARSIVPSGYVDNGVNSPDMLDEKKDADLAKIFETIDACVETIANVQLYPKECDDVSFEDSFERTNDQVVADIHHPDTRNRSGSPDCHSPEHLNSPETDHGSSLCEDSPTHHPTCATSNEDNVVKDNTTVTEDADNPIGLPLEKVDEDDVFSGCTTSSETPDTETIIDNYPLNVSPLPDDETCDHNMTEYQGGRVPSPGMCALPEVLEDISEENSLELQESADETGAVYLNDLNDQNIDQIQDLDHDDYMDNDDNELDECADQLSPLDVIDQIEARLMQQLQQEALEDLDESTGKLEDEVNRQLMYLSEDSDLLDELDAPRNAVPPSEPPPPPPPPEVERSQNPFQRNNSTKRIKKEIWRRRSDFLGLDSSEGINVDDLPPPPPGLEQLLKSEMEIQREQRLMIEKRLSLSEPEYANVSDSINSITESSESFNPIEEYTTQYIAEVLNGETDEPETEGNDSWGNEKECHMPNPEIEEDSSSPGSNNAKDCQKPKSNIQSLGAAPKAKIMESNKWITEKHLPVTKQTSVDPIFRDGSYNQNFWIAQDAEKRNSFDRGHVTVDRRYSMPVSYSSGQPDVTVRTWDDRESEYQSQPRPKSNVWTGRSASVGQTPNAAPDYYRSQHSNSWTDVSNSCEERNDDSQLCSYCGQALTEVSAMGIEALQLYFHIECFHCCLCHLQLGNGTCGTDVQVKNNQLYCPKCFNLD